MLALKFPHQGLRCLYSRLCCSFNWCSSPITTHFETFNKAWQYSCFLTREPFSFSFRSCRIKLSSFGKVKSFKATSRVGGSGVRSSRASDGIVALPHAIRSQRGGGGESVDFQHQRISSLSYMIPISSRWDCAKPIKVQYSMFYQHCMLIQDKQFKIARS